MKPPICGVCDREFSEGLADGEGDLLYFRRHEDPPPDDPHRTGHPSNAEWFCPDHVEAARELTHLTLPEARARLDEDAE